MKKLEQLLEILHYFFHALDEACWAGKEILRVRRESRESEDESTRKGKKKKS